MKLVEREEFIKKLVKNKIVLDIGSCAENKGQRLFNEYKKITKNIIGIDLFTTNPEIIKADCQNFNLNKKFDIIIVGEVIEHLSNFEGFFNSLRKHLNENGKVIITTPNPISFIRLIGKLIRNEPSNNPWHTVLLDSIVFKNLANNNNFKVLNSYYYYEKASTLFWYKFNNYFSYLFPKFALGYVFVIKNNKK